MESLGMGKVEDVVEVDIRVDELVEGDQSSVTILMKFDIS
jgi:hypothetical protein